MDHESSAVVEALSRDGTLLVAMENPHLKQSWFIAVLLSF